MSYQFLVPPNEKIFCLLSHEKISFSKRKSHGFSVLGPPQMRKYPVACLMRKSHVSRENIMSYQFWPSQWENILSLVSWENLMSQEKISCLISFGSPQTKKSPVSCIIRKSQALRDNLMSFQFWVPPNEKISCLLSHEKISCLKRKSHILSVLGPPP